MSPFKLQWRHQHDLFLGWGRGKKKWEKCAPNAQKLYFCRLYIRSNFNIFVIMHVMGGGGVSKHFEGKLPHAPPPRGAATKAVILIVNNFGKSLLKTREGYNSL